jgi:multimeric flavodoxin WrbA
VIYYSSTGTNYKLTQTAAEAAKEAGAEVRVLKVQELAPEEAIEKIQPGRLIMRQRKRYRSLHLMTLYGRMQSFSALRHVLKM